MKRAQYAVGYSVSLSVGIQPPPDVDGIWASRVQSYRWHQQPLLWVQSFAVTNPPSCTSLLTLSHLAMLTSAVCPVLPASIWLRTALKPITALCPKMDTSLTKLSLATHKYLSLSLTPYLPLPPSCAPFPLLVSLCPCHHTANKSCAGEWCV